MRTALVTGAAGFIGSHLVEELLERGYVVRGLDNLSTGYRENFAGIESTADFTFIEGDIRNRDDLEKALDDVSVVFHQAANAAVARSFEEPATVTAVNATGTAKLFEAAVDAEVEKTVVASSAAIYGDDPELPKQEDMPPAPQSPYALSKQYTERLARQLGTYHDIETVALRYFNVYGPRQDPDGDYAPVIPAFIDLMSQGERPTIYGDGEQTRDFVFVGDVARANLLAAESEYEGVLNIASGERTSINDLVDQVNEILGANLDPVYEDERPGDIRHSVASIERARDAIDYEPETDFGSGLSQTVAAMTGES